MNIDEESLKLHYDNHGKLEIKSKVPLNSADDLARAYTPGVAAVSRAVHEDEAKVRDLTCTGNMIAVVSDGSAVLGLGNIGAKAAMPVMEGKAVLFKEFADVDAVPIVLDTQDVDKIVETVAMIAPSFSGINLEDISAPRCFDVKKKLQERLDIPVLHDDQNGTAIVVLAGLINALKVRGLTVEKAKIVVNGAGAAGTAIIKLLTKYGFQNITVIDSSGVLNKERTCLSDDKQYLCEIVSNVCAMGDSSRCDVHTLEEAIKDTDIFIGVSVGGVLKKEMVESMNEKPIIFAMANPVPEIMPDEALEAGAFIVATGRSDFPNQVNNVLAFPGLFRGALDSGLKEFTQEMYLAVASVLADMVDNPTSERIMPDALDRNVAKVVAKAVIEVAGKQ